MGRVLVLALLFGAVSARAEGPQPPTSLPTLDWKCFASFSVSFAPPGSNFQELGLDGDNLKKPRIELHVVDNQILKVIENPEIPQTRKEYAVELWRITQDFIRHNPVYAWREEQGFLVKIYVLNVNDRVLSRTQVVKPDTRLSNENEVFVCK